MKITETIHEQHCQDKETIESLSLGGLAILRTILSPSNSEVKLKGCGSDVLLRAPSLSITSITRVFNSKARKILFLLNNSKVDYLHFQNL